MSDDNNEKVKEKEKEKTIRFEIELKEFADKDTYVHIDYLDLVRELKEKEKKKNGVVNSEVVENESEDPEIEALARLYEEKYGRCNDYAKLGEGYDDDDSFIDNADAVNDLVPSGVQTEFGGFYINRGKLVLVEDSSSSNSENAEKFIQHAKRCTRRITSDSEEDGKREKRVVDVAQPVKNRKRSGEFSAKNNKNPKKFRKMATPKIPDHLLQKKPFSGSEFNKITEIKKNRLKNVDGVDKSDGVTPNSEVVVETKEVNQIPVKKIPKENHKNNSQNHSDVDDVIEAVVTGGGGKPVPTAYDLNIEKAIEAVATGADIAEKEKDEKEKEAESDSSSSSSSSSNSSSSDSDSDSSSETSDNAVSSSPRRKSPVRAAPEVKESSPRREEVETIKTTSAAAAPRPTLPDDNIQQLINKISATSREEKCRASTQKLDKLLLNLDEKLQDRPSWEKNDVLDRVSLSLQVKKGSIIKRTKKLQFNQQENLMSIPMRRLKEAVADMMPRLESDHFKEFAKAAGTSPQIYAELSQYYWSIDPGTLPQRKFPWNDTLRGYLQEIVRLRTNCYHIVRPRKESLQDYIQTFLEFKVKSFWPKDWMTMEILYREVQVSSIKPDIGVIAAHSRLPTIPPSNAGRKPQSLPPGPKPRKHGPTSKAMLVPRKALQPSNSSGALLNLPPRAPANPVGRPPKQSHQVVELPGPPIALPRLSPNAHSAAPPGSPRHSPTALTITQNSRHSAVDPDILNLTKNSAVSISKVPNRSASPNINVPLPAGTTISPATSSAASFLSRADLPATITLTKHDGKSLPSVDVAVVKSENKTAAPSRECSVIKHDAKTISLLREVTLSKHEVKSTALSREIEISIAKPISPQKDVWRENNPSRIENPANHRVRPEPAKDLRKEPVTSNSHETAENPWVDAAKSDAWRGSADKHQSNPQDSRKIIKVRNDIHANNKFKNDNPRDGRQLDADLSAVKKSGNKDSSLSIIPDVAVSNTDSDRYKYMPVRKRAVQEYNDNNSVASTELPRPNVADKGLEVFSKMLDKVKVTETGSNNVGSISVQKFAKADPAPPHNNLQLELSRVMQEILEVSRNNGPNAQDPSTAPSTFHHAFKNSHHN